MVASVKRENGKMLIVPSSLPLQQMLLNGYTPE